MAGLVFGRMLQRELHDLCEGAGLTVRTWVASYRTAHAENRPVPELVQACERCEIQGLIVPFFWLGQLPWLTRLPVALTVLGEDPLPHSVSASLNQLMELGLQELARQGCRSVGLIASLSTTSPRPASRNTPYLTTFRKQAAELKLTVRDSWLHMLSRQEEHDHEEFGYTRFQRFWHTSWGVFLHFLAAPASSSLGEETDADVWNRRVDAFDVPGLLRQLQEIRPGYVVVTLGQNSGHYCVPNETYDRITGIRPSKCARRDLVADLHAALAPHGIRLMVYLPAGAPEYAPQAVAALEWHKGGRCAEFQRKWEAVIREWSLRWGSKVSGWWFDGCYYNDDMYRHPDEPNFRSFAAAIRAGNPDSLIGWNPGVKYPPFTVDAEEDYTAGEINEPRDVDSPGRWVQHAQFHMLTYLGRTWGQLPIRFTAAEAIAHTLPFTDCGGVVTWDVPHSYEGLIVPEAFPILREIGRAVDATRGRADLPPPPVVHPAVTFVETPTAGDRACAAGRLQVTLRNPWPQPIRGDVSCALEPESAIAIDGNRCFPYDLPPGGETRAMLAFHLKADGSAAGAPMRLVLTRSNSLRPLVYPLPRRERVRIPQLGRLPALAELSRALAEQPERMAITREGQRLGDIRLALADGHLALSTRVSDAAMRQTANIWDGSCVEVFAVAAPGDMICQLFLVPATANAPAKAYEILRSADGSTRVVPWPDLPFATWSNPAGYTSAVLIPLARWLQRSAMPPRFFLEIVVSSGLAAHQFGRAVLFGSDSPPNSSDGYAAVEY